MNKRFGYVRVAASVPEIKVANVEFNVKEIVNEIKKLAKEGVQVVTFPELSITGYTCGDLFNQDFLVEKSIESSSVKLYVPQNLHPTHLLLELELKVITLLSFLK